MAPLHPERYITSTSFSWSMATRAAARSAHGAPDGALAHGCATAELRHETGVRHDKLMISCGCKSHPAKAVAGKPGPSLAGVAGHLHDLCERVHTGRYRPQPVRRVYIPKADGGKRPLGVPALEDKIVQSAVAEVLSAVYEVDFCGFSYGFRPGRDGRAGCGKSARPDM